MANIKTYEQFKNASYITSKMLNVNESKVISVPHGGFTLKEIESILKKEKDIELSTSTATLYITPYMHRKGKLSDADENSLFAVDSNGREVEVSFDDIVSVTTN